MKKKIYLFNSKSKAAIYGIGTYIDQLTNCLKSAAIDFEVIYLNTDDKEITVCEKKNYKEIAIPAISVNNPNFNKCYARNLAYILKEFIPDDKQTRYIFHLNFMSDPALATALKKHFRCKILLVAHYTDWSFSLLGNEKKLLSILKRSPKEIKNEQEKDILKSIRQDEKMIQKCDQLVCVAQHTLNSFNKAIQIDKNKTVIVNNALIDKYKEITVTEKQRLKQKYLLGEESKVIVFAGRLEEVKGIRFLIQAFREIIKTHPNTHLFIAGEGYFPPLLEETGTCCTKISFTGRLEKKQLFELYYMADIGVVSSVHEEFGFVAIEMMMHTLPIIVSDTGGLAEIVEDGSSGLKVPVRTRKDKRVLDTKILTEKIKLLIDNPAIANTIAQNGRKRFLDKYEITLFKEKMLHLYESI